MTFKDYLRLVQEQLWLICAVVASALLLAALFLILRTDQYTARLTLYVSSQSTDNANSAYQGSLLSQERVKSYTELVTSPRVAQQVVSDLQLDRTAGDVAGATSASSVPDSVLIDVSVRDADPVEAARIANATGTAFTGLVDELERPSAPGVVQPVVVRVVQNALPPDAPSSVSALTILGLALLGGLLIGLAAALVRTSLDNTIKSPEQLSAASGRSVLGTIAYEEDVDESPIVIRKTTSARAEAYRQLRTNLQFADVDSPRRTIIVTSPLPAEGKTTSALNLAGALAASGERTLLIEADLRRPAASSVLGLEKSVGLTSVLSSRVGIAQASQRTQWGFDVLASGPTPPNPSEILGSERMRSILEEAQQRYDYVVIDAPPLLPVTDAAVMAPSTHGVVLVVRYGRTTIAQTKAATDLLAGVSAKVLGSILSMVPNAGPRAYAKYNSYYTSKPEQELDLDSDTIQEGSVQGLGTPGTNVAARRPVPHRRATPTSKID